MLRRPVETTALNGHAIAAGECPLLLAQGPAAGREACQRLLSGASLAMWEEALRSAPPHAELHSHGWSLRLLLARANKVAKYLASQGDAERRQEKGTKWKLAYSAGVSLLHLVSHCLTWSHRETEKYCASLIRPTSAFGQPASQSDP